MLELVSLSKQYPDGTTAVDGVSLTVRKGEFVVLIGPSGCGKSTTLRMINRLIEPTAGTITLDGQDFTAYNPVALRRRFGYVIQQIGLMPHLTIAENISFVLRLKGVKRADRRKRAEELLRLVGMEPVQFLDRYPKELSGGQQQRIGVLRALAHDPDIILMDEPFGALDPLIREQLQDELLRLQRSVQKTIIFVTHDMDEALKMADRIVVMRDGRIVQDAPPEDLLRTPADDFVASFIGRQRLLRQASEVTVGEVQSDTAVSIPEDAGLAQALELMRRRRVNSLMVTGHQQTLIGIALLRDVQVALQHGDELPIGRYAKHPLVAVNPQEPVMHAIRFMLAESVDAVPVIDDTGRLLGVVTRGALAGVLNDVCRSGSGAPSTAEDEGWLPVQHATS